MAAENGVAHRRRRAKRLDQVAASGALLLEPIEPRILLNSGVLAVQLASVPNDMQDHDILVSMVEQTVVVGQQSQQIARVQVVDQTDNNTVLATGDLTSIGAIAIAGAPGGDRVAIDTDSFGTATLPPISFTGGGGVNTIAIEHKAGTVATWTIDGKGGGDVTGDGLQLSFSDVSALVGGQGRDILAGPAPNTTWNVTGAGSGAVDGTSFTGFEHLQGAADNADTFVLSPGGAMADGIDGGAGGDDTVEVAGGQYANVTTTVSGPQSGGIDLDGDVIDYSGMEPITSTATTPDLTLSLAPSGNDATLSVQSAGTLALSDPGVAETQFFVLPTGTLTIDLGSISTLAIDTLGTFPAALDIVGDASDGVTLAGAVATSGHDLVVNAGSIALDAGVTIDTASGVGKAGAGQAGDVTLAGTTVSLAAGSTLDAMPTSGPLAGAISITATNQAARALTLPIDFVAQSAGIDAEGATITGGSVSIETAASDLSSSSDIGTEDYGFTGALGTLLNDAFKEATKLTGLDATVSERGADASIVVDNTSVSALDSIRILGTVDVSATTEAIVSQPGSLSSSEEAFGYAQSAGTVTADITGTSSLTAGGSVLVETDGTVANSVTATTASSTGATPDPSSSTISLAASSTDLDAQTLIGNAVTITATTGSVGINANGTATTATASNATTYTDGTAGVAGALAFDFANVKAELNGHVTAGGTVGVNDGSTFDGADPDTVADGSFTIPNNGLATGEQVTYQASGTTPIGGLKNGATYTVVVTGPDTFELLGAPVIALDASSVPAVSTQTLTKTASTTFSLDAISNNAIQLAGNGFTVGDSVTYTANPGAPAITGLTSGATYVVLADDGNNVTFAAPGSTTAIAISQGSATGTQTFTDTTSNVTETVNLAAIDTANNAIVLPGYGIANGTQVIFDAIDTGAPSIGAVAGTTYTLAALSANEFQLLDGTTPVQLSTSNGAGLHDLVWEDAPVAFDPATAVNAGLATIALPGTTLQTGDQVIYKVDPSVANTIQVALQDGAAAAGSIPVLEGDTPIGGLTDNGVYYVVRVDANDIRLAATLADALAAAPIAVTPGNGTADSLSAGATALGIGVDATLADTTTTTAAPAVGATPPKTTAQDAEGDLASLGKLVGGATASGEATAPTDETGTAKTTSNDGLSGAGALALTYVSHDVDALVGDLATAANPVVLSTPADITVDATITQTESASANASVTKPSGTSGSAAAFGAIINIFGNTASALIEPNATVDAGGTVSVDSLVDYAPLITAGGGGSLLPAIPDASAVTNYLAETLLDTPDLVNNWASVTTTTSGQNAVAVTGAVVVSVFNNNSDAEIMSGAQIDQTDTPARRTQHQSVSVAANTVVTLYDIAGIGSFSTLSNSKLTALSASLSGYTLNVPNGAPDLFGSAGGSASLGASATITDLNDTTTALIDTGAKVYTGVQGLLQVLANESITRVELAQSGGTSGSGGKLSFAGSLAGYRQRSTTIASLAGTATGGGAVTVSAGSGGVQISIAGDLVKTSSGSSIGIGATVDDIVRDTEALIGPASVAGSAGTNAVDAGSLAVTAATTGDLVSLAVAGVAQTQSAPSSGSGGSGSSAPPTDTSTDNTLAGVSTPSDLDQSTTTTTMSGGGSSTQSGSQAAQSASVSGIGLAGAATVVVVADTTDALVDTTGTVTATGPVALTATDSGIEVDLAGGVALSTTSSTKADIAGAFAVNQNTDVTRARIIGTTVDAAGSGVMLTAEREGALYAVAAGVAASTNATTSAVAGSVVVNRELGTTEATLAGVGLIASTLSETATDATTIDAFAGGIAVTAGQTGVGASFGFNQISATTIAGVTGGQASTIGLAGAMTVEATDADTIAADAISAGVALDGSGIAVTVAFSIISSDPSIFGATDGSGIEATIGDATVTGATDVTVAATDNSTIQSIAGALGIGGEAAGVGAGLSWDEVTLTISATIADDATIDASGAVDVTATSTAGDGLTGGKIAALAISAGGGAGAAVGASVAVDGIQNTITATVASGADVSAGSVAITAADDAVIQNLVGGAAVSTGSAGVGAAVAGNYVANTVTASVVGATVAAAAGNVSVDASENAVIEALTIGLAGGAEAGIAGSLTVAVIANQVLATIGAEAVVSATGTVAVTSTDDARISAVAGAVAASGGVGVGAAITDATVVDSNIATVSGSATVTGLAGVTVAATTTQDVSILAAAGAASPDVSVAGSAVVSVLTDDTIASIDGDDVASPPGAGVTAGNGAVDSGDVDVLATTDSTLLGTAGALSFGGDVGVGVGASAGVASQTTRAFVGHGALVTAAGNVDVAATASEDILSVSATGAGGEVGVGGSAGVSTLDLTTTATIDSDATVRALANVLVAAADTTGQTEIAGALAAGVVGVGVAAAIGTVDKDTEAHIEAGANVSGLGEGAGIAAATGAFASGAGGDAETPAVSLSFATNAVGADGVITGSTAGFATGDQVIYDGATRPLASLVNDGVYFIRVIDADHFALATTAADAASDNVIAVGPGTSAATDTNTIQKMTDLGVPAVKTTSFDGSALVLNPFGAAETSTVHGVAVTAISTNDFETAGAAAGGGGVGVAVAATIPIHDITTIASVDAGASVDTVAGAAADQDVEVAAGRAYRDLAIGIGAAVSAEGSAAPGVAAPVLQGSTEALVGTAGGGTGTTTVAAAGDIAVTANALESVVALATGVAASGEVALAGSGASIDIATTTAALIGGAATVTAGGNVAVEATDRSTTDAIAGAVGIGLGGGAGAGAVAVTILDRAVTAAIESGATVTADAGSGNAIAGVLGSAVNPDGSLPFVAGVTGLAVEALSVETLDDVAGSGAGGAFAGIAGAVDVERLADTTTAAIAGGADVTSLGAVAVGAADAVTETDLAGALGASLGLGVGAGIDVNQLDDAVAAFIGAPGDTASSTVTASGAATVAALSSQSVTSDAIGAAAAGVLALGGGISVLSIGGAFNSSYSDGGSSGSSSGSSDALSGGAGGSVSGLVDGSQSGALGAAETPSTGALPTITPASISGNVIDFGTATGLATGDTVFYSADGNPPIGGLVDGQAYFAIVVDADHVELAATRAAALAGTALALDAAVATGSQSFAASAADLGNMARGAAGTSESATPAASLGGKASGTVASIGGAARVTAGSLAVAADQQQVIAVNAGGAGLAVGAAVGVGLAIVNIDSDVDAMVAEGAVLEAGTAAGALAVTATRNTDVTVLGVAGAGSFYLSLGSALADVADISAVNAELGAGAGTIATTATGFSSVDVAATGTEDVAIGTAEAVVGGFVALGAAIVDASLATDITAAIGPDATVTTAGAVTVDASGTTVLAPHNPNGSLGVALAVAGGGAAAGGAALLTIGGAVSAMIGAESDIAAGGAVSVTATADIATGSLADPAPLMLDGTAAGLLAIGLLYGSLAIDVATSIAIGANAKLSASDGDIDIAADETIDAGLETKPAIGGIGSAGLIAGAGDVTTITIGSSAPGTPPTVALTVGNDATIAAADAASLTTDAATDITGDATGGNYGGVTVGASATTIDTAVTSNLTLGDTDTVTGSSVLIAATGTDAATADAQGAASSVVGDETANATVVQIDSTTVTLGSDTITAPGAVTIASTGTMTGSADPDSDANGLGDDLYATGVDHATITVATAIARPRPRSAAARSRSPPNCGRRGQHAQHHQVRERRQRPDHRCQLERDRQRQRVNRQNDTIDSTGAVVVDATAGTLDVSATPDGTADSIAPTTR